MAIDFWTGGRAKNKLDIKTVSSAGKKYAIDKGENCRTAVNSESLSRAFGKDNRQLFTGADEVGTRTDGLSRRHPTLHIG